MADSRQTKVVTYELQGNTVSLERALSSAISTLDALDSKLTSISTQAYQIGNKTMNSFKRASTISAAESQLDKLRQTLGELDITKVAPDQLNMLNQMGRELENIQTQLNRAKNETRVSQATIDKARRSLHTMNLKLKQSNVTMQEHISLWKQMRTSVSKFASIVATIKVVISYFEKFYDETSDYIEVMNLFNTATGKSNAELREFADTLAEAYMTDDKPIVNAIATFRQFGNTMGFATKQADILSKGLTQMTYDLASMYNTDYDTMMRIVKSGLAGQTKSLMQYGISVHQATLEQTALNLGLNKSWSQFSETEKVALRYITILDQASLAQGDLARTLESPSNQMKILRSQMIVLVRNVGKWIVMLSKYVLPLLNAAATSLNTLLGTLAEAAGFEIENYADGLLSSNQLLEDGTEAAEDYADALKNTLAPLDEINQQSNASSNTQTGFGSIDPKILGALKVYDNQITQISNGTSALMEALKEALDPAFFEGVGSVLKLIFDILGTGITGATNVLSTVMPVLGPILAALGTILSLASRLVNVVLSPVLKAVELLTSNIWLLVAAFAALNLAQVAATGNFQSMMAVKILIWFRNLTAAILKNTTVLLGNVAATLKAKIASAAMAIAAWWEAAAWWQKAIAVIASAGALAAVVASVALSSSGAAAATANSTLQQKPNIPKMAKGGVVDSPTVALIGEGKYREAVVPLGNSPQFKGMQESIADTVTLKLEQQNRPSSQRSGTPIILQINGKDIARAILPDLGITRPQTGVRLA